MQRNTDDTDKEKKNPTTHIFLFCFVFLNWHAYMIGNCWTRLLDETESCECLVQIVIIILLRRLLLLLMLLLPLLLLRLLLLLLLFFFDSGWCHHFGALPPPSVVEFLFHPPHSLPLLLFKYFHPFSQLSRHTLWKLMCPLGCFHTPDLGPWSTPGWFCLANDFNLTDENVAVIWNCLKSLSL